jgi:hypothetical protein
MIFPERRASSSGILQGVHALKDARRDDVAAVNNGDYGQ